MTEHCRHMHLHDWTFKVVVVWVGDTIPVKHFSRFGVFPGIGFGPKSGDRRHDFRILRG